MTRASGAHWIALSVSLLLAVGIGIGTYAAVVTGFETRDRGKALCAEHASTYVRYQDGFYQCRNLDGTMSGYKR